MSVELTIKGDVEVLRLHPGDIIVLTLEGNLPPEKAHAVQEQAKQRFPDHKIVVLANGISLSVQRDEAAV